MAKNGQTAEIASFLIERLSAMRVKNNFSQRELSLRIGKESSYINRMEQSKFIPSVDTLYAIVEACNASMEELFYYGYGAISRRRGAVKALPLFFQRKKGSAHQIFADALKTKRQRAGPSFSDEPPPFFNQTGAGQKPRAPRSFSC